MARGKRHVPTAETRATVKMLAAYGTPHDAICKVVGIDNPKTLRKHYRETLDTAMVMANGKVAESLFKRAVEGKGQSAVVAAIFWLKCRANWSEISRTEITGAGGAPLIPEQRTVVILPSNGRELQAIEANAAKRLPKRKEEVVIDVDAE